MAPGLMDTGILETDYAGNLFAENKVPLCFLHFMVGRLFMKTVNPWSRILLTTGNIALLVGAIDPMEGSLLILPASGLVALGTFLGQSKRGVIIFRILVFFLITIGVVSLWLLSMAGGFGGSSGYSMWWGLLILPYLIGLSISIWGPGSPRWMLWPGIVVSLWYLAILMMALNSSQLDIDALPVIAIGTTGFLTLGGCIYRMRKNNSVYRG